MRNTALSRRPALTAALLAASTLAALVWAGLDLRFLGLPLGLCGALLVLSRLTLWLRGTNMAERVIWRRRRAGEAATRVLRLTEVLPVAQRLLADLGWTALALGLLSAIPELPGVVSRHSWGPDVAHLSRYLSRFNSLAIWGVFLLAPFIVARAVAEVRPDISGIVDVPWTRLAAFGAAYALLADDGALAAAFALDGSWVLLGLGVAWGVSYVALVIRRAMAFNPSRRLAESSVPGGGVRDRRAWQDKDHRVILTNDKDEGGERDGQGEDGRAGAAAQGGG